MSDKIDIHNMERLYENMKKSIASDASMQVDNRKLILEYLRESELGKTIMKGQKKKIYAGRNVRVAGILRLMDKDWFKKPFREITVKDMEEFILKFESGKIKSNRGTPYSSETQITIKKFIRKFWKWMKCGGRTYPLEVDWIDTSGESADIRALPRLRKDVEKMAEFAPDFLKKAMIMVLFDSGTREGEFLNMRIGDLERGEDGTLSVRIRHSKTFQRRIGLPISTLTLQAWLDVHPRKDEPDALLWEHEIISDGKKKVVAVSKAYFYNNIKRLGRKALGMNVTPQMFRHTSATYHTTLLDRATFCKRFGWSFASKMPDRYIDWAGIPEEKAIKAVKANDMQVMWDEWKEMKEELSRVKEEMHIMKIEKDNYKLGFMGSLGGKSKKSFDILKKIIIDAGIPEKDQKRVLDRFKNSQLSFDDSILSLNPEEIPNHVKALRKKYQSGWLERAILTRT